MSEKAIIIDVPGWQSRAEELAEFGFNTLVMDALTVALISWERWAAFDPATTLLVFPGSGARMVWDDLPASWRRQWRASAVQAKRVWAPGEPPVAIVSRIFPDQMLLGIRDVIIVDDVISSGMTACALRRINYPWIPGTTWHAATWVLQRSAVRRGFANVFGAVEVGEANSKAPVNSLSTLLASSEVARSLAKRHVDSAQHTSFLRLLGHA